MPQNKLLRQGKKIIGVVNIIDENDKKGAHAIEVTGIKPGTKDELFYNDPNQNGYNIYRLSDLRSAFYLIKIQ